MTQPLLDAPDLKPSTLLSESVKSSLCRIRAMCYTPPGGQSEAMSPARPSVIPRPTANSRPIGPAQKRSRLHPQLRTPMLETLVGTTAPGCFTDFVVEAARAPPSNLWEQEGAVGRLLVRPFWLAPFSWPFERQAARHEPRGGNYRCRACPSSKSSLNIDTPGPLGPTSLPSAFVLDWTPFPPGV